MRPRRLNLGARTSRPHTRVKLASAFIKINLGGSIVRSETPRELRFLLLKRRPAHNAPVSVAPRARGRARPVACRQGVRLRCRKTLKPAHVRVDEETLLRLRVQSR